MAALAPDVILAPGASTVGPLLQATRTVPIVFPIIADPVAGGFVDSLARPGGNATGFMLFEYSISGKWLELLKQIAPDVTRVAVLGDTSTPTGPAQFGVIQAVAPSLRVEVTSLNKRDAGEIERTVTAFARSPNGGLIVTAGGRALLNRDLIIKQAALHKLPAIYFDRSFAYVDRPNVYADCRRHRLDNCKLSNPRRYGWIAKDCCTRNVGRDLSQQF